MPFSKAKITKHNVNTLIPWFCKFKVTPMLKECEGIYHKMKKTDQQSECVICQDNKEVRSNMTENCLNDELHQVIWNKLMKMDGLTADEMKCSEAIQWTKSMYGPKANSEKLFDAEFSKYFDLYFPHQNYLMNN